MPSTSTFFDPDLVTIWDQPPIRAEVEERIGGKLPESLRGFRPLRHLMLVVSDPKSDQTEGGIMIPEKYQAKTGIVYPIIIGPWVGVGGDGRYEPSWPDQDYHNLNLLRHLQTRLLGQRVMTGLGVAREIYVDTRDRAFDARFGLIHAADPWALVGSEKEQP